MFTEKTSKNNDFFSQEKITNLSHFTSELFLTFSPPPNRGTPCNREGGGSRSLTKSDCGGNSIRTSGTQNNPQFEQADQLLDQGKFQEALNLFTEALKVYQTQKDSIGEANTMNAIGLAYDALGNYGQALKFHQQALTIFQQVNNMEGMGNTYNLMGGIYYALGNNEEALNLYQKSLEIQDQLENSTIKSELLNNIGLVYFELKRYDEALDFLQKALTISQEKEDFFGMGRTLTNLGYVYLALNNYQQALILLQEALTIHQKREDQVSESLTLASLGFAYFNLNQSREALTYYYSALIIAHNIGNRPGESQILYYMGRIFEAEKQEKEAIIFYKQSVNLSEFIRQDLEGVSLQNQEIYADLIEDRYRRLANLLLREDRILEAQRVIDLLKVEELDHYLQGVRGNDNLQEGIEYLSSEKEIIEQQNQLSQQGILLGKRIEEIRQIPTDQRNFTQNQEILDITLQQQQLSREFAEFTRRPDIINYFEQLNFTAREQSLQLSTLKILSDSLSKIEPTTVLLYPLILEDRLELILVVPNSPPIHRTISVTKNELNETILEARSSLTNFRRDDFQSLEKLYNWLIKPIENDLALINAKTIIYAPDSRLRYIPFNALYDGKQWLIEKYSLNQITAASLTNLTTSPQAKIKLLLGAFVHGSHIYQIEGQNISYQGLPFAGIEAENLSKIIPNNTILVDENFSKNSIFSRLNDYTIIHFATHAHFVSGQPENSFIALGNGESLTLAEVRDQWYLNNVDLIVLSACETAIGGYLGNGEEILGFGYLMQEAGAKASLASLWQVSDGGTQFLMTEFYRHLSSENLTKVEALRQAQITMIHSSEMAHPYYWSSFVLIGNGL